MRAKGKGGVYDDSALLDLLGALADVRTQGLDLKTLGVTKELMRDLVVTAIKRRPKAQRREALEQFKIAELSIPIGPTRCRHRPLMRI